jgi:hypothetical protein
MSTLTCIFESKDEEDAFLQQGCIMPIMDNNISELLKWKSSQLSDNKKMIYDDYFLSILNACKTMQKAKEHKNRYPQEKEKAIGDIKISREQEPSHKDINFAYDLDTITSEVEAFLVQIKKGLDFLSLSFNAIFPTNCAGWRRGKENGKKISGLRVIKDLENLSVRDYPRINNLTSFLRAQEGNLSLAVFTRDNLIHPPKNSSPITNFEYITQKQIIQPPHILTPDGYIEADDFMTQTYAFITNFLQDCIVLTLDSIDSEIRVGRDSKGEITLTIITPKTNKEEN